ncbi:MAG: monofunctional biosynthetic peptidoglycan transglycosylase [Flavobacteriaceae bacterium]|nr:monofunctional biosynthetic peptidoglycan transglycosylase [Flavobacteriaceae bacterium]
MRAIRYVFKLMIKAFLWFLLLSIALVILYRFVPVPLTPLMVIRAIEQKTEGKKVVLKHDWVSMENMSPHLQLAVVSSEDQLFLSHRGFDVQAIEKALENNQKGRRIKGASTISQQTAKNVFLWPNRSWIRKGFEVYFTFLIETFWDKERILEVYLNSIEMGPGIYGAEAASQFWFHKSAKNLNRDQSAALAAILPNPLRYKANPPSNYIQQRKNWILRQMNNLGPLYFKEP